MSASLALRLDISPKNENGNKFEIAYLPDISVSDLRHLSRVKMFAPDLMDQLNKADSMTQAKILELLKPSISAPSAAPASAIHSDVDFGMITRAFTLDCVGFDGFTHLQNCFAQLGTIDRFSHESLPFCVASSASRTYLIVQIWDTTFSDSDLLRSAFPLHAHALFAAHFDCCCLYLQMATKKSRIPLSMQARRL